MFFMVSSRQPPPKEGEMRSDFVLVKFFYICLEYYLTKKPIKKMSSGNRYVHSFYFCAGIPPFPLERVGERTNSNFLQNRSLQNYRLPQTYLNHLHLIRLQIRRYSHRHCQIQSFFPLLHPAFRHEKK